jgi:Rrf2 family protein
VKITAQEEYGIRCLLELGRRGPGASATIPEISRAEGISKEYVAKLMRILRRSGLVRSLRGQSGGYVLARPLEEITVGEALSALGGPLYTAGFCAQHVHEGTCRRSIECSVRSLWNAVQEAVDDALAGKTLADLLPRRLLPGTGAPEDKPAPTVELNSLV